jgi:hypothetical protein
VVDGLPEMRVGMGDAQGQGYGFLPRVLQAATVQGKEAGKAAGGRIEAVRTVRLRVHRKRCQCDCEVAALLFLL